MEMRHFFSQLEATLGSGITPGRALHLISQNIKSWQLKRKVQEMERIVQSGGQLSEAVARVGKPFNKMHISFLKFGEETGCLDKVCGALAKHAEKETAISRQIMQAMIYPLSLVLAALIAQPIISAIIEQGGAAGINAGLVWPITRNFLFFGAFLGIMYFIQGLISEGLFDNILIQIPFISSLMKELALARFSRALAISQLAGVPLMQGISTAIEVSGNPWLQNRFRNLAAQVGTGKGIAEALENAGVLPGTIKEMITVGEQSGKLPEMLEKTAIYYEEEVAHKVALLLKVLPIIFLLPVAIYIGYTIINYAQQIFTSFKIE